MICFPYSSIINQEVFDKSTFKTCFFCLYIYNSNKYDIIDYMSWIIFLIAGGLIAAIIIKSLLSKYPKTDEDPYAEMREETENPETDVVQENDSEVSEQEFDKEYFERCQNGEGYQLFMKFASINDCVFLQGLLSAEHIPSHVEHQHMNGLFGAGANVLSGTFAAQLWILVADYEKAYDIAVQYIVKKSESLEVSKDTKLKEGVAAALVVLLGTPYPITKSQQILGMTIFPKLGSDD